MPRFGPENGRCQLDLDFSPILPMCRLTIPEIRKSSWVSLEGLVTCVTKQLSKPECVSISFLGYGASNYVYRLEFTDGSDVACSVYRGTEDTFNSDYKRSELATMAFVRESGLYPSIPVPKVHAWDLTFTNAAGAPYMVMDMVHGRVVERPATPEGLWGFHSLEAQDQVALTTALAKLKAALSRPVPFDKIGSPMQSEDGQFYVGKLDFFRDRGPYTSVADMWYESLADAIMKKADQWSHLEEREPIEGDSYTSPQRFASIIGMLSALVPLFTPPSQYQQIVLDHPDLALRNVLFHPDDLTKIVGVIDWSGAQFLPLMLASQYPKDLISHSHSPVTHPDCPRPEQWHSVPHDWTYTGDISKYNKVSQAVGGIHLPLDMNVHVGARIRVFYLRQLFALTYAREVTTVWKDLDISRAHVFSDAPCYLKFHEVVGTAHFARIWQEDWVRETFYRMQVHPPQPGSLIVGPNTYRGYAEALVYDLGMVQDLEKPRTTATLEEIFEAFKVHAE